MKAKYTTPTAEIDMFSSEDIITTSMVGTDTQEQIADIAGLGLYKE